MPWHRYRAMLVLRALNIIVLEENWVVAFSINIDLITNEEAFSPAV